MIAIIILPIQQPSAAGLEAAHYLFSNLIGGETVFWIGLAITSLIMLCVWVYRAFRNECYSYTFLELLLLLMFVLYGFAIWPLYIVAAIAYGIYKLAKTITNNQ
jgi:hypothetical protein